MKKIALITGGTSGIGAAIAQELKAAGYTVAVTFHGDEERARSFSEKTKIPVFKWDVGDYDACVKGMEQVKSEIGDPDILVNNAGITKDRMMHKMSYEEWHDVLRTNLDSVFNITRQVITSMREKKFGRIVSISSINAQKGQLGQTNYCSAKAGIIGFTRALAQEVAKSNITVNAIAPGYIRTAMVGKMPEDVLNQIIAQIPVGRLGQPEEIARIVCFLVSDSSSFITGSVISANGGQYFSG